MAEEVLEASKKVAGYYKKTVEAIDQFDEEAFESGYGY